MSVLLFLFDEWYWKTEVKMFDLEDGRMVMSSTYQFAANIKA